MTTIYRDSVRDAVREAFADEIKNEVKMKITQDIKMIISAAMDAVIITAGPELQAELEKIIIESLDTTIPP